MTLPYVTTKPALPRSICTVVRLRRRALALPVLLLALTLLLALLAACGGGGDNAGDPLGELNLVQDPARPGPVPAPEFPGGHTWFNVEQPLILAALRGKVVVLDFWTLGCINCQHIIPDEERLEQEFGDALVIIGVHSGKYDREHADQSVREAVLRLGLVHPVVNDPEFDIWSTYGVHAWPTIYVIDPAGDVVGWRSGEGVYDAIQPAVKHLVDKFRDTIDRTPIAIDLESTGAASSVLSFPSAVLADDSAGRLFIADSGHNRIVIAGLDGTLQAVIGNGKPGLDDGTYAEATFRDPQGLTLSADGSTLYVADTRNHAIRAVDLTTRDVRTIAGNGRQATDFPQPGASAAETALASPWGLVEHEGTLYIAMAGTHQLWALDLSGGMVSIFAGTAREGIADGPRLQATLAQPNGLTTDGESLFWVDPESSSVRRVPIAGDGPVRTLVGTGLFDFGDVDGLPPAARLQHAQGIVYSGGLLYVADTYNHKIKIVDPSTRAVRTLAGTSDSGFLDGDSKTAQLNEPGGVSIGGNIIFIADTNNNVIRRYALESATVSTLGFSNLRVAVQNVEGRTLKVSLPAQTVSPAATTLRIRLTAPEGFHLNSLAPSRLSFSSSNAPALSLGEDSASFTTDEPSTEIIVPAQLHAGDAILSLQGEVYYCRTGDEGICLIDDLDLALPLTISSAAAQAEIALDYALPPVPE